MNGLKVAAGAVFMGILAASFYSVGVDQRDGRLLSTQEEFQQEAKNLLQKGGYEPIAVKSFDLYETSEVAQMEYSIRSNGRDGSAFVACSGSEVLEAATHCKIGSIAFK